MTNSDEQAAKTSDDQGGETPEDELRLEKRPALDEDLPVEEAEAADVQGGRAPPYVPVGPGY